MIGSEYANADVSAILSDAGMTVLIGLVVVFSVLVLLTLIFKMFSMVVGGKKEKPVSAPTAKPALVAEKPVPAPAVQSGVPEEVVAVIAAAVAAMSDENTTYAVRRITRAKSGRSAWASAAAYENTHSF